MIDVAAMRQRLQDAKERYMEVVREHGLGSEEARQAFVDLSMAVYGNATELEPAGHA